MTTQKIRDSEEYEWELIKRVTGAQDEDKDKWEAQRDQASFNPLAIGWRLRWERKKSGLTQEDVAKVMGVTSRTVMRWEHGICDITLKDAYYLMMLYRRIPGHREYWDIANLNALTNSPMI